jgi:hypothetical protein
MLDAVHIFVFASQRHGDSGPSIVGERVLAGKLVGRLIGIFQSWQASWGFVGNWADIPSAIWLSAEMSRNPITARERKNVGER